MMKLTQEQNPKMSTIYAGQNHVPTTDIQLHTYTGEKLGGRNIDVWCGQQ